MKYFSVLTAWSFVLLLKISDKLLFVFSCYLVNKSPVAHLRTRATI